MLDRFFFAIYPLQPSIISTSNKGSKDMSTKGIKVTFIFYCLIRTATVY